MVKDFSNGNAEADYGQAYESFYSKYYDELEQFARDFFIENYEDEVTFNDAYNDLNKFLWNDFRKDIFCPTNEKLNELNHLFYKELPRFKSNSVQKVFKNIIRPDFDKIDVANLPEAYNFMKFIEEVAFIQSTSEISRLLSYNNFYFEMFYDSNRLGAFEIRDYHPLAKEDYPHYKEMYAELFLKHKNNENLGVTENEVQDDLKINEVKFNKNDWNEITFQLFNYLVANYEKKGKVKYVNIYKFLKKIDKTHYAFNFTVDKFKAFILDKEGVQLTNFDGAKYEYEDNEKPILLGFEQDFRKQV